MKISDEFVPELCSSVSFVPFKKNQFTLCIDSESEVKLNISIVTKSLLELIDGKRTIANLTWEFNQNYKTNLSTQNIIDVFNNQLLGYGILKGDSYTKINTEDSRSYLKLRFTIINQVMVRRIAFLFEPLFNKIFFISALIASLLICTFSYIYFIDFSTVLLQIDKSLFGNFVFIYFASVFFHEFGHAAACSKYGAKNGAIGFGFYLFYPVFYADVSDVWRLKRQERIIVDAGGIYMQLLMCLLLCILFYGTQEITYLYMSFLLSTTLIININPFIKYDGYWILSDALNIPNLGSKSQNALRQLFKKLTNQNGKLLNTHENWFLVIYGSISVAFLLYFLTFMVVLQSDSVIYFPVELFKTISLIFTNPEKVTFDWARDSFYHLVLPFTFYYLLIRFFINKVKQIINRNRALREQNI